MECPICYTNAAFCNLCCGHSFCTSCIKEWYNKTSADEATCPMCRGSICFKGFSSLKNQWEKEKIDNMYEEVYMEVLDEEFELSEEDGDVEFLDEQIEFIQEKFNKLIMLKQQNIYLTRDEMYDILADVRYDVEINRMYELNANGDDSAMRALQFLATLKTYRRLARGSITKYRTKKIVDGISYELIVEFILI